MYIFSKNTLGFYPTEMRDTYEAAGTWPEDGVEVSDQQFQEFSGMPPTGKTRGAGEDGFPAWVDIPPLPDSEYTAAARNLRNTFLDATDKLLISDYSIKDTPLSDTQKTQLQQTRNLYRKWPLKDNWPFTRLPDTPDWILTEAQKHGFHQTWPPTELAERIH